MKHCSVMDRSTLTQGYDRGGMLHDGPKTDFYDSRLLQH